MAPTVDELQFITVAKAFIKMNFSCSLDDYAALAALAVPVPNREGDRLKVMRESNIIDGNFMDEDYDRLTALVARVFKAPICLITIVDVDVVWLKSNVGLNAKQVHRNDAICSWVVLEDSPECLQVPNILKDTRFQHLPVAVGPLQLRYYAGAAIKLGGEKMGSLCIFDTVPHPPLDSTKQEILLGIASIVSQTLTKRHSEVMSKALEATKLAMSIVYNLKQPLHIACDLNKSLAEEYESVSRGGSPEMKQDSAECSDQHLLCQFQQNMADFCVNMKHIAALIETSLNYAHARDMQRCDVVQHVVAVQDTLQHLLVSSQHCNVQWTVDESLFQNKVHFTFPYALQQALLCSIFNLSVEWTDIHVQVAFEATDNAVGSTVDGSIVVRIECRSARSPRNAHKQKTNTDCELGYLVVENVLASVGGGFDSTYCSNVPTNSVFCTRADDADALSDATATTAVDETACFDSLARVLESVSIDVPIVLIQPLARGPHCRCTMTVPCVLLPRSAKKTGNKY